ncbi:MAG TPA: PP2C family protein-serine/threonine phosphatase [Blastocatellia bacterium]|nr:PP2C family protein-serine/threonine phosphatase [Blastocatellia bacterium]
MSTPLDASHLEALLESAQLLHASLDLDDLLKHLLRTVMGRLLVTKGLIAVEENGVMRLALVRGLPKLKTGEPFDEQAARAAGVELMLPIGDAAQPTGLLGIGPSAKRAVSDEEIEFLRALLGIAANGIANARAHTEANRLNEDLDQKIQELHALLDLVRALTSTLEPEDIARLLILTLAGRWAVRKYAIAAWKEGHPTVVRQKGIELADLEAHKEMLTTLPEALSVADLPDCPLKESLLSQQARVLFVIRSSDKSSGGVVVLGPRPGTLGFSEADFEFGAGLVAQAAVAFDNSWYFKETLEKKKMEQELTLAASIQSTLFPAEMPKLMGYDLAAHNRPARHCGGDYYDVLPIPSASEQQSYLLCVADVSGKGLPASLLMSNMQATLRALLGRLASLTDLCAHTNELLYATTPSNKYVTAILVEIDPATGRGRYVNAGHTDCLLLRADGEAHWLKSTGTPLGLMPPDLVMLRPYEEGSFELQPGDLIALFSDGVTEAQNEKEEEYGEARVADFMRRIRNESARMMVDQVFDEIDRFAGIAPQFDDITLLILKRNS